MSKENACVIAGCSADHGAVGFYGQHYRVSSAKGKDSTPETRLKAVWKAMLQRCNNPNQRYYKDYGGRGISVCQSWTVFENFKNDIGYPKEGESLDRIDNDGNYTPENCRWADIYTQQSNKRLLKLGISGYRGVHFDKPTGKWRASFESHKKTIFVGRFDTPEEAYTNLQRKREQLSQF